MTRQDCWCCSFTLYNLLPFSITEQASIITTSTYLSSTYQPGARTCYPATFILHRQSTSPVKPRSYAPRQNEVFSVVSASCWPYHNFSCILCYSCLDEKLNEGLSTPRPNIDNVELFVDGLQPLFNLLPSLDVAPLVCQLPLARPTLNPELYVGFSMLLRMSTEVRHYI